MALKIRCSGQELINEVNNLRREVSDEVVKNDDFNTLEVKSLKSRFGGMSFIERRKIPNELYYTAPEGMRYIGKIEPVGDNLEYVCAIYEGEGLGKKIEVYICNVDNSIQNLIYKSQSTFSEVEVVLDCENKHVFVYEQGSNADVITNHKVLQVNDNATTSILLSLVDNTGISYKGRDAFLYNNALYISSYKLSNVANATSKKIDYSQGQQNLIITDFNEDFREGVSESSQISYGIRGDDLYVYNHEKAVITKFKDGVGNYSGEKQRFETGITSSDDDSIYHNNTQFFDFKKWDRTQSTIKWFCEDTDSFFALSDCKYDDTNGARNLFTGTTLKPLAADEDYLLLCEGLNDSYASIHCNLFLINYRENKILWRAPFTDLVGTSVPARCESAFILDSTNMEFLILCDDGYADVYKIILSDTK